ncbi:hypothetical protein FRB96_002442 [Tulasnella sp. 330]|nr:hypothetical protein FRB96_002442 [Tulasnella sp. 330]KAG8885611.1 hypothetical protein FRB97_000519 [Tulasnella sp. 331]KAG8889946.1 hypothetical protein FRB98_001992 [Tulasnella sp. 332]
MALVQRRGLASRAAKYARTGTVRYQSASAAYIHEPPNQSTTSTPDDLTPRQRKYLQSAIRVDQAGELAANAIYQGQLFVLGRDKKVGPVIEACIGFSSSTDAAAQNSWLIYVSIQEMWEQEKKHFKVMNQLQIQHRVRPTALWEVARVAGFGLGAVTALMGKEAAMACTEAVETAIGEHYDE